MILAELVTVLANVVWAILLGAFIGRLCATPVRAPFLLLSGIISPFMATGLDVAFSVITHVVAFCVMVLYLSDGTDQLSATAEITEPTDTADATDTGPTPDQAHTQSRDPDPSPASTNPIPSTAASPESIPEPAYDHEIWPPEDAFHD